MKSWLKKGFKLLPWHVRDVIFYSRTFRRFPNLRNPKTFNEKTLCRKHYDCYSNARFPLLADKYQVREYVSAKIGQQYLIPLVCVLDKVEELAALQSHLKDTVVKPTHGAGMVHFFDEVPDDEGLKQAQQLFQRWLETDYTAHAGEHHYSMIPRRLVVEQRIVGEQTHLTDYKFHLFRQPDNTYWYVLQMIDCRFDGDMQHRFYVNALTSEELNPLRPALQQALALSVPLMGELEYARIDWYIAQGQPWFGEITLTPAAGFSCAIGDELDQLMGQHWHYQKPVKGMQSARLRQA